LAGRRSRPLLLLQRMMQMPMCLPRDACFCHGAEQGLPAGPTRASHDDVANHAVSGRHVWRVSFESGTRAERVLAQRFPEKI